MTLAIGQTVPLSGNVTQLKAFGAKAPAGVEEMLGYHNGRLARGYWICVLVEPLFASDFELDGTTLRSGGKMGLPGSTQSDDDSRTRVHDTIIKDYGAPGYAALQEGVLRQITPLGPDRLAKVVPVVPHMIHASPARQYPMGGGSLQWRIKKPGKLFYVAAFVDAQGLAQTPSFSVRIDPAAPYDGRARFRQYLEQAT